MSEFLAEARILVRPDTTRFRAELEAQVAAATRRPVVVPINFVATAGGAATAAAATASLVGAQERAASSTATLTGLAQAENTTFARQAVLLEATTAATLETAGAQATLAAAQKQSASALLGAASASSKLDAALLGLRTAVGSAAVIGLGALSLAAIAAGQAIRASIQNFIAFQQGLSTFRVVAGATAQQMEEVRRAAIALGEDVRLPGVSASDAAVAMTELAKAGLSVQDSIAGATGVLELATAAQISNAEAAQIAANALNAFGLAGDQATRVADDLANAANAAQGSISDIGLGFSQAAAVARQVGLSLEDTTAILALFAKNGLQGSDAGTALRTAIIRLVAPSKQASAEIKELGLQIRDAQGNLRPDIFAQFGEATEDLAPAARDAAAALIFGQDAIRAVSIGAREGTEGLRLMQFQIDQTGTAAEVAAARNEGLGGSFAALTSGLSTLSLNFGKLISLGLKPYVEIASSVVSVTNQISSAIDDLATAALNAETPLGKVKDRLFDVASVGVPIIGEIRLIRAGLDQLGVGSDENSEKLQNLQDELKALQAARIAAERGGQSGIADALTKQIQGLRQEIDALKKAGDEIPEAVTSNLRDAITELEKVRDVRIDLGVDTTGIERLIARLREQIPITQQTEGNIQRLRDDVRGLGQDSSGAAGGVQTLAQALAGLARQSAQTQAELLRLQTEGGTAGQQIGALQADIDAQRKIIAEAKARGGEGSATAIKQARLQILQDQAQIDALISEQASAAKKAKDDAQQVLNDRDDALLTLLGNRREDARRRAGVAGQTAGLQDDIRAQDRIQALIKIQIAKIRALVQDEQTRKQAIRELRIALIASRQEEEELRKQQLADAAAAAQTSIELDINFAQTTNNVEREIRARQRLIALLKKQQAAVKKGSNEWKRLRNAIAEQQQAIKDAQKQAQQGEDDRKSAQQFFFEQLQDQQGFASNLLGNLIPRGQTAGLVGNAAPTAVDVGQRITVESAAAQGKALGGPTAGQANATNDLLLKILQQLRHLNGLEDAPEATRQRRANRASLDYAVM